MPFTAIRKIILIFCHYFDFYYLTYHGSKRSCTTAGFHLGQRLLIQICALPTLLEVTLHLTVLGQVEGGNLLGLLDLLLVGFDLGLQLGGEVGHPVLVLLVLTGSEGELLALTLISLGHCWGPP